MPLTVAQLVARLSADTSGFYRSMAIANASMIRTGGIASRVFAGAGLATTAFGFLALRAAGNYQQSMNILEAVSGATERQMKAMGKEAIDLGADIKLPNVSAKDAADAMTELGKAGLSVKDIMGATRGTLQMGLAANIGFADSAVLVSRALKAFQLPGTQAVTIANLFAAGANASTAEITDLAYGMQNASTQFSGAGYSIQDMVVALSGLVDRGLSGEQAGTALKVMLQRLQNPTKRAAAELKSLGVNISDVHGNMLPIPNIVGQFAKGFEKLNPLQRQQALNTIFGQRANAAMMKLVQIGVGGWEEYRKKIVGTNAAQKMTEARTKGLNGALQGLGSQVETLAINLGMAMVPAATKAVRAISDFVAAINSQAIINFFGAIKDGVVWVYNLVNGSTALKAIVTGLVVGLAAYATVVTTIGIVTKAWAIAQALLNAVMSMNPIGLVIGALVALAAGLIYAYQHSETFRNIVNDVFQMLKNGAQAVWEVSKQIVAALVNAWNVSQPYIRMLANFILSTWGQITAFTRTTWNLFLSIIETVWKILGPAVTAWANVMWAVIKAAWNNIVAITTSVWNVIKTIVTSVLDVIHGKISAMQALKNIVGAVWNAISKITTTAWNGIKGIVGAALDGILSVIQSAATAVWSLASSLGSSLIDGIVNGVKGFGGKVKDAVIGVLKGALTVDIPGFSPPEHAAKKAIGEPLGRGIILGFLMGSADLPAKINAKLKAALEAGKRQVDAYQSKFKDAFSRLADNAMSAFDAATAAHLGPAGTLLKQMQEEHDAAALQKTYTDAQKAVMDAQNALAAAYGAKYDTAEEKNKAITQAEKDRNDAVDALQEAGYQITIANLQKQADTEQKAWEDKRNYQKSKLDEMLQDLEASLLQHPEKWKFYQEKTLALLKSYGISYKESGLLLGKWFEKGLIESEAGIIAEARKIAAAVARILKLHSPAEEGPLSDLDKWWTPFASTLLSGLNIGEIQDALSSLSPGRITGSYSAGAAALGTATGGASGPVYYNQYYVQGSLISEAELDNRIRSGLTNEAGRGRVIAV